MANQQTFSESIRTSAVEGRRILMPLIDNLLPRIASISQQELMADPAQWGRTIMQTNDLVGGDTIAICVDPDITLTGCGAKLNWDGDAKVCVGEISISDGLDTEALSDYLQMLEGVVRSPLRNKPCAVAMLGPATLVSRLFQEVPSKARFNEIKGHLTALAETLCALRPELILFIEDEAVLSQANLQDLRRIYNTLNNVAGYYEVSSALLTDSVTPEQVQALSKLKLDALLVSEIQSGDALQGLLEAASEWSLVGLSLPTDPEQARSLLDHIDTVGAVAPSQLFYITPGQLPQDCDLEQVREVNRQVSAGQC